MIAPDTTKVSFHNKHYRPSIGSVSVVCEECLATRVALFLGLMASDNRFARKGEKVVHWRRPLRVKSKNRATPYQGRQLRSSIGTGVFAVSLRANHFALVEAYHLFG